MTTQIVRWQSADGPDRLMLVVVDAIGASAEQTHSVLMSLATHVDQDGRQPKVFLAIDIEDAKRIMWPSAGTWDDRLGEYGAMAWLDRVPRRAADPHTRPDGRPLHLDANFINEPTGCHFGPDALASALFPCGAPFTPSLHDVFGIKVGDEVPSDGWWTSAVPVDWGRFPEAAA